MVLKISTQARPAPIPSAAPPSAPTRRGKSKSGARPGRPRRQAGGGCARRGIRPYGDDIDARLTARHFRYPVTVRQYDDSGHFATSLPPYANYTVAALNTTGGSVEGTQASNVDFRNQLLTFLGL